MVVIIKAESDLCANGLRSAACLAYIHLHYICKRANQEKIQRCCAPWRCQVELRHSQPYKISYFSPLFFLTSATCFAPRAAIILPTVAELLGVVASGIAVVDAAGQLGSGIRKLRRLWNEVKDVPETIQSMMQQLELLAVVIEEMDTIHRVNANDSSATFHSQGIQLSMVRCREAMDLLDGLVNKLSQHIDSANRLRRTKTKIKVALKKDDLARHQDRLDGAVRLLQLAQGCYQM